MRREGANCLFRVVSLTVSIALASMTLRQMGNIRRPSSFPPGYSYFFQHRPSFFGDWVPRTASSCISCSTFTPFPIDCLPTKCPWYFLLDLQLFDHLNYFLKFYGRKLWRLLGLHRFGVDLFSRLDRFQSIRSGLRRVWNEDASRTLFVSAGVLLFWHQQQSRKVHAKLWSGKEGT